METAQNSKSPKIVLLVLISFIIILLGFNFALSRYGAFWRKPQPKISPPPLEFPKETEFAIGCPVPQEYCQAGRNFIWEGKSIGVGFMIPEGTPLLSVFDGEINQGAGTNVEGVSSKILFLTSRDGYRAVYFFLGQVEKLIFAVRKGDVLGRVSNELISPSQRVNLLFTIEREGKSLPITSDSFQ